MGALQILGGLASRAAVIAGLRAPGGGMHWNWVSNNANPWGNGDRGPLGSWQMNLGQGKGYEQLAFSAVYGCVNVIAQDVSKLPPIVYSVDLKTGAREALRGDYYVGLFREPNNYQTCTDFLFAFVQSYLIQGNTYCYIGKRNGRGEVAEMHVLNPHKVQALMADNGAVFYECGEDFAAGLKANTRVPERDMIHHRLPLIPGYPLVGVSPIFAAAASSAVGIKILQNSQQFFANASRPAGSLNAPGKVSEPTAKRLQEDWDNNYRGENFGKTAILPEGLTWNPLTITAQDAQLIEQLRWSVEDVARVFRVPPFMLGDMTKVTYRNNEQLVRAYLTGCLGSHITAIESRFARAFEFPLTYEFKFDLTQFLRMETDIRYAAYGAALKDGWQSINEVRSQEGYAPVTGGDEPRIQMQYVPLSKANEPPPEPAPPVNDDPPPDDPPAADDTNDDPPPEDAKKAPKAVQRRLMRRRVRRALEAA